jgi:RNA polymerase sigma factor (sigma-70 family)
VNADEIDTLYRDHRAAILGYLVRRTAAPEDAADLLAEVFIVAIRRPDQVPSDSSARLWLFGVARHVLANHHRGLRRRDAAVDRLADALRVQAAAQAPAPATAAAMDVRAELRKLPAIDRELLTLVAWDGLTPAEAACVLELNPATARTRLMRARRRLRNAVQMQADEDVELCTVIRTSPA